MTRILLVFFLFVFSSVCCFAQKKLVFQNDQLHETIEIKEGDYVKLRYKGYLNQEAEVENFVLEINDATINFHYAGKKNRYRDDRMVLLSDVTGFRRMSKMKPFLAPLTSIGVGVGIYYAFGNDEVFNNTQQLFYSLGASLGTSLLINWVFKSEIKLKMSDGWYIRVVSPSF
ncbi:hypothetical protein N6H18_08315 [Reichenbachiella agarivorans]|uniref:Uncharacterized protein n=1 Tax=Reichenbachiella agarivorans TaxID=2979464 RepID=A0ABY6CTV4_9BACT|nr:hypothetical protein [Reichenbachiella agarivorans]UXP33947.1 hypothetical protein N6H18_08315 [Reichenbachiella agarivorans]